jgi:hypothetical protein
MATCLNCGSQVSENDIVCSACGFDPKSKGVRILEDNSSVEKFDAGGIGVSGKTEIYCPNCGKKYKKSLLRCVNCNESNPYEDFPLRNYIINIFFSYSSIGIAVVLLFGLISAFQGHLSSLIVGIPLAFIFIILIMAVAIPIRGIMECLFFLFGRFLKNLLFKPK